MLAHVAGFGARCIEVTLVVDHVPGFDADSGLLLAHVAGFDADSSSKGPWWSTTWRASAHSSSRGPWWSTMS
ncbi:MAG: hypothetical protein ACOX69_07970 [Coriobacteriales bacterium]